MKRKLVFLLCLAMMAGTLSACGKEPTELSKIKTNAYVTLGEYKGITVSEKSPSISDEEVDAQIKAFLSQSKSTKEVDRAAKDGDVVNIDYTGKVDGKAFDGGSGTGYDLTLGSSTFIDGFESGLTGTKKGDSKELNLTFPKEYGNKDLAGKAVVFTVKVNKVSESVTPELNDEFVKTTNTGCKTVADFKKYVSGKMLEQAKQTYESDITSKLIDTLIKKSKFKKDPPQFLTDRYEKQYKNSLNNYAAQYGMTSEQFLKQTGMTTQQFETEAQKQGKDSAQKAIILQAVANAEGIKITDKEYQTELENSAKSAGTTVEEYKKNQDLSNLKDYLMFEKTIEVLKKNATIKEEAATDSKGIAVPGGTDTTETSTEAAKTK